LAVPTIGQFGNLVQLSKPDAAWQLIYIADYSQIFPIILMKFFLIMLSNAHDNKVRQFGYFKYLISIFKFREEETAIKYF
jgi:hypothetical protein